MVASNGRLRRVVPAPGGARAYEWFVSTPINAYDVALNIAPYRTVEGELESVAGGRFPVVFYVLPEDEARGRALFPEILDHLRFFERLLGPYPFRADKYGVAQTPHLGMKHQTIIAYGARFDNAAMTGGGDWGFDALHHHELSHEWWGNLVTNADWKDMWLHEGFGSYMQALYMEQRAGRGAATWDYVRGPARQHRQPGPRGAARIAHRRADLLRRGRRHLRQGLLVPAHAALGGGRPGAVPLAAAHGVPGPGSGSAPPAARRRASPPRTTSCASPSARPAWSWGGCSRCTCASPRSRASSRSARGDTLRLRWEVPGGLPFPMPVEVETDGRRRRVEMPGGRGELAVPRGARLVVDPDGWVLRENQDPLVPTGR